MSFGNYFLRAPKFGEIVLVGDDGNDTLSGLGGDDRLYGGAGNDKLAGSGGRDLFVFNTAQVDNVDTIINYRLADDGLQPDAAIFTALADPGALNSNCFKANATGTATDANDFILYNTL